MAEARATLSGKAAKLKGMRVKDTLIVLDTVDEGYLRFDGESRLTFANQAAGLILGKSRTKLLGKKLGDICPLSEDRPFEDACRRAMADHVAGTFEHYLESNHQWYAVTALPDSGGGIVVRFADITHHKLTEDALRKSEEKFSKAFRSSPVPMAIVDVDKNSCFLDINESFERVTGFRRDEIIGRTSTELGLYSDLRDLQESRKRLMAEGGYRNLEFRFRKKNGDLLVGLISAEQIELAGSVCAIATAVDVTESRRAAQALQESEELYRQLFEVESDAILLVDRESGTLLAANAAASSLYGYSRDELLSMNRIHLSAEPEETIRATMEMRTFIPLRWHRKKDGTVFPVEISGCYFDLKGRSVFVSAIRDITNRKLIEEALKKSEEKFSKAFHSNPTAIVIADLSNRSYLEVNPTFEQATGYRRDEVVGHDWADLCLWTDPLVRDKVVVELLREGSIRNFEYRFRKKHGEEGVGLLSAELMEIDGKQCAITTTVDITERLHLESQLRQAQRLESVGRLAGGVAHDFNNLLTIINGYSRLILNALQPSDPLHSYAQEVSKAGDHAAALTKQLLAFSRKQILEPRLLDVNTVVKETGRMLRRLIGEDIELTTKLDPFLGQVMVDPDQIHQVIMNLVVNARDAMPDGGKLGITTENTVVDESFPTAHPDALPGKYVVMTVTDNGLGMDERTLQSAFEPFFTTKEHGKGTGLGLSTVYGIVRQSGGWLDVRSEVGRGSSFKVYIPRVEAGPTPVPAATTSKALRGGETVLVVEDQEAVRELSKTILEEYGYHVLEATNGDEALTFVEQHPDEIDLLLADVILPGMNGMDLSIRLRELRPKLKVLFTSGYPADVIARRGVLERDVAYLPKPLSPETLVAKVREVLGSDQTRSGRC
jgi:two-component system, cell cycle sensor histidine kinase and response regulator CckA